MSAKSRCSASILLDPFLSDIQIRRKGEFISELRPLGCYAYVPLMMRKFVSGMPAPINSAKVTFIVVLGAPFTAV